MDFNSVQQLEPTTTSTTQHQSPRLPTTTQLSAPDTHVQPLPLAGPRPMKKYTGNGQAPFNRNPTGLVSDMLIPFRIQHISGEIRTLGRSHIRDLKIL